jgi:hypothetical protein
MFSSSQIFPTILELQRRSKVFFTIVKALIGGFVLDFFFLKKKMLGQPSA